MPETTADTLQADVLVIGGGMAGAWAALGAARAGAQVVLVEKGYCGTSGVTASAGPGHWWVPPQAREQAIAQRLAAGEGLAEARWMERVLDTTWRHLPTIAPHYAFGVDAKGVVQYRALRGPEYLRALRTLVNAAGVRVLDHHPATELLRHGDGSIAGACGLHLRGSGIPWEIRAGATVIAAGGCAFLSKLLGADNNTGDGYLMAAEAGAELSGMEFTNYYTVAPAWSSMTRSMSYAFARYFDADGRELDIPFGPGATAALARALLDGPVACTLERMPQDLRELLPTISPNVLIAFTRAGVDPFRDRFPVTLRGAGTVRGIGGLRVAGEGCETSVPNLFAAGDAASRERVAGAISGGGAINSAWALSSGLWSGQAAAARARRDGRRADGPARPAGQAGLHAGASGWDRTAAVATVQRATLDYDRNIFRSANGLGESVTALDGVWRAISAGGCAPAPADPVQRLRLRETAALVATARWSVHSAFLRPESRGMHRRVDAPASDPAWAHRIVTGGLDRIWHRAEPAGTGPAQPIHPLTTATP
ncbi:FAD-dependent oxidoreductase [Xylophilus sp.]|uniref:FAD-dependent oxidoreductase n=1 Tax=Xylophilus sp. TaxID=2653893 RepID=UPI0013BD630E|nr:FAD-binding protein [Xylophilus sp.]KAF1042969.1 MAG: Succinate dehydrogenase flavoprotein subunit [Xylophilus sp.]